MFAPRMIQAKSTTPQRTNGDRVTLPLASQRSAVAEQTHQQSVEHAAGMSRREPTHSWDFGKIPIFASSRDERSTSVPGLRGPIGNATPARVERDQNEIATAIQTAIERKRGGGRPLGDASRRQMERSFGADFGSVRVHADAEAGLLSGAIGAVAFTTGKDLFFGRGAYNPDSVAGRQLLAHELTHVVQQGEGAPSRLVLGEAGDRYEREADATAKKVAGTPSHPEETKESVASHSVPPMAISRLSSATFGAVQRDKDKKKPSTTEPAKKEAIEAKPVGPQPVETWAGVFSAPDFVVGTYGPGNYGADIEITFTPKAPVDAESIALVQTNRSFLSSRTGNLEPLDDVPQPGTVGAAKEADAHRNQDVFKSRLVDKGSDFGTHIDAAPASRTPLAYMSNPPKKNDQSLSSSVPGPDRQKKHTQFGWQTPKKGMQPAQTGDIPNLLVGKDDSASQIFETTAVALEGVQKGTYYGSVQWGWTKKAGLEADDAIDAIDLKLSKNAAPSPTFFKAAEKWNVSTDSAGEPSIPLPISSNKVVNAGSDLIDSPDKGGKPLGKLDRGTTVGTFEDASHPELVRVVVTSGKKHKGEIGWIKSSALSDPKPEEPKGLKSKKK